MRWGDEGKALISCTYFELFYSHFDGLRKMHWFIASLLLIFCGWIYDCTDIVQQYCCNLVKLIWLKNGLSVKQIILSITIIVPGYTTSIFIKILSRVFVQKLVIPFLHEKIVLTLVRIQLCAGVLIIMLKLDHEEESKSHWWWKCNLVLLECIFIPPSVTKHNL